MLWVKKGHPHKMVITTQHWLNTIVMQGDSAAAILTMANPITSMELSLGLRIIETNACFQYTFTEHRV